MNRLRVFWSALAASVILFAGAATLADAAPPSQPPPVAALSSAFTYQGRLLSGSGPASGSYDLVFRLYDTASGGAQIGSAVTLNGVAVSNGLFAVQLDFGAGAFAGGARWLEVAVAGTTLSPRQPLTATPYALYAPTAAQATLAQTATLALSAQAAPWSGLTGRPAGLDDGDDVGLTSVGWTDVLNRPAGLDDGDDNTTYTAGKGLQLNGTQFLAQGSPFSNTVVVAKGGGDFGSIQSAINSITNAGPNNPYLVVVASGVYTEQVTLKPYVSLRGAGQGSTIIRWTGGNQHPESGGASATLRGASSSSIEDLAVESLNGGYSVGIHNLNTSSVVRNVTVRTVGHSGSQTYGIYNYGATVQLENLTVTAIDGTFNVSLYNFAGGTVTLADSTITSTSSGTTSAGVHNYAALLVVRNSVIRGSLSSVARASGTVQVAHSQLVGTLSGGLTCIYNYDANLAPVTCP